MRTKFVLSAGPSHTGSRLKRTLGIAVMVLVAAACGGDDSGDPDRFCGLNAELEQFYGGDFLPDDVRREHGRSRIVSALQHPLVRFDFDEVNEFGATFNEFVEAAPDEIRPAVTSLAGLFAPVFDFAADPTGSDVDFDTQMAAFSDEAQSAGFAIEDWVSANCEAG